MYDLKDRMEISLGTEETVMVGFFTTFTSPSPPNTHSFSYQKEETHLYQSEASAGFNYLFSVYWYSSGESLTNMAAMQRAVCAGGVGGGRRGGQSAL
jgi:hypothetical protein